MIFFGSNRLKSKARKMAKYLVTIEDHQEFSLACYQHARELASWKHLWAAKHVDEAWNAISHAVVSERVQQLVNNVKGMVKVE